MSKQRRILVETPTATEFRPATVVRMNSPAPSRPSAFDAVKAQENLRALEIAHEMAKREDRMANEVRTLDLPSEVRVSKASDGHFVWSV